VAAPQRPFSRTSYLSAIRRSNLAAAALRPLVVKALIEAGG
jgi:hypothetical protein